VAAADVASGDGRWRAVSEGGRLRAGGERGRASVGGRRSARAPGTSASRDVPRRSPPRTEQAVGRAALEGVQVAPAERDPCLERPRRVGRGVAVVGRVEAAAVRLDERLLARRGHRDAVVERRRAPRELVAARPRGQGREATAVRDDAPDERVVRGAPHLAEAVAGRADVTARVQRGQEDVPPRRREHGAERGRGVRDAVLRARVAAVVALVEAAVHADESAPLGQVRFAFDGRGGGPRRTDGDDGDRLRGVVHEPTQALDAVGADDAGAGVEVVVGDPRRLRAPPVVRPLVDPRSDRHVRPARSSNRAAMDARQAASPLPVSTSPVSSPGVRSSCASAHASSTSVPTSVANATDVGPSASAAPVPDADAVSPARTVSVSVSSMAPPTPTSARPGFNPPPARGTVAGARPGRPPPPSHDGRSRRTDLRARSSRSRFELCCSL
jgi:hypothetical protein